MLSIITCSVNTSYLDRLTNSIESTVHIPYELIVFDNTHSNLSITQAYNKAATDAKYDYLVFVHEDVEFLENGWAERLISILQKDGVGVVGIAGSTYLPSSPSGWYLPDEQYNCVYIKQGFKYSKLPERLDDQGKDLTRVYLLDGVFLGVKKHIFDEFKFNEKIEGYHMYDIDFCQRVATKYANLFTKQIFLIHHSEGKVDKSYFDSMLLCKTLFMNYNYGIRNRKLELEILTHLFHQLRMYYSPSESKVRLKPFVTIKSVGLIKYFTFNKLLNL